MARRSRFKVEKMKRQVKVAKVLRKNPYLSHSELAKVLKVSPSTIGADIAEIKANCVRMSTEDFLFHRNRVLREIHDMKQKCLTQLNKLRMEPSKGTRWVEEYTKLIEKEARILGLYAPELRIMALKRLDPDNVDKEQRDAAINAAAYGQDSEIIDITPLQIAYDEN